MKSLFEAVLKLENVDEVEKFFVDLCTLQELRILKERWEVCQLLDSGQLSYREISEKTGASTTTVTRVARFLRDEPFKGYRCVLDKIERESNRPLSKPSESEFLIGDTEYRSGVYLGVHEHSSTGSTPQKADCEELGRGSNED
ncbi:MAG: hypothetical protein LBJ77_00625 [Holosporales bacterium]|nr:hypothetical protein [Holosporales bacterium]